jgi:hypothetical protein
MSLFTIIIPFKGMSWIKKMLHNDKINPNTTPIILHILTHIENNLPDIIPYYGWIIHAGYDQNGNWHFNQSEPNRLCESSLYIAHTEFKCTQYIE